MGCRGVGAVVAGCFCGVGGRWSGVVLLVLSVVERVEAGSGLRLVGIIAGNGQVRGRVVDVCVSTDFVHYLSSHPTMWGLALGMWTVVSLVGLQWCHFQHTNLLFHSWIDRPSVVASGGMSVLGLGRLVDFVVGPRLFVGVGG